MGRASSDDRIALLEGESPRKVKGGAESLNRHGPVTTVAHADVKAAQMQVPKIVYLYVLFAGLTNSLFGFEMGVISGAKIYFAKEFGFRDDPFLYGLSASASTLGALFGTILAGPMQDKWSRKVTMCIFCLDYIAGAVFTSLSTGVAMIIIGRLIVGLAVGAFPSTVSLYVAELSPKEMRGKLVSFNQVMCVVGIVFGFVVDLAYGDKWRWMLVTGVPLAFLMFIAFAVIAPRTPRWLLVNRKYEQACKVLATVRGGSVPKHIASGEDTGNSKVDAEVHDIMSGIESATDASAKLRERHVKCALWVGVGLAAVQQFTGVNAVNFYAQDIFKDAGFSTSNSFEMSVYIGLVKLPMVVVALVLIDRVGRKILLQVALVGMMVSVLVLATVLHIDPHPSAKMGWVAAASLLLFMSTFEIGLGPVLWVALAEFYPLAVRGKAMAVGSAACWLFTFIVVEGFPPLKDAISVPGVFFTYGGFCFISIGFVAYFVPETKGLSMAQVEGVFRKRYGTPRKHEPLESVDVEDTTGTIAGRRDSP